MSDNPGKANTDPEVLAALDTVGISDIGDTRINPATEANQLGRTNIDL